MSLLNVNKKDYMANDTKYSRTTHIPQYQIKGEKPFLQELYDNRKVIKLLDEIKKSDFGVLTFLGNSIVGTLFLLFSNAKILSITLALLSLSCVLALLQLTLTPNLSHSAISLSPFNVQKRI